jgi:CRP-like cAMP-binding protein
VRGTPTFFIGGRRHTGPYDAGTLAAALLADAGEDAGAAPAGAAPVLPFLGMQGAGRRPDPDAPLPDLPGDLPETPDRDGDHPRLTDDQLARFDRHGARQRVAAGDVLYRPGDPGYDFHVIVSGAVAVVGFLGRPDGPVIRVHGERRFLGALDILSSKPVSRTAVVIRSGEVLRLTPDQLRTVMSTDPELGELVLRAYLARLAIAFEHSADLRILGRPGSPEVRRLQDYADAHRLTTEVVDVDAGDDGDGILAELGASESDLPVVVSSTGRVLHNPGDAELGRAVRGSG